MSPTIRNQAKLAGIALAAVLAFTAFGSGDARAGFNVKGFSCAADPFGVNVDVSGLGNTNVCVEGSADVDLDCACVGGGGNCPTDNKKQTTPVTITASQSVEPKNGRVITTFDLDFNPVDGLCTTEAPSLNCPSGQDEKLIAWEIPEGGADFTLCTTTVPGGGDCSCAGQPALAEQTCGPTSDIVFPGKRGSCAALFP
jgi:hypothetical protein